MEKLLNCSINESTAVRDMVKLLVQEMEEKIKILRKKCNNIIKVILYSF